MTTSNNLPTNILERLEARIRTRVLTADSSDEAIALELCSRSFTKRDLAPHLPEVRAILAANSVEHREIQVEGMKNFIEREERAREKVRASGSKADLDLFDEEIAESRLLLAEALLGLSMARRDAGDHQGALDAARLFANQEHLAKSTFERIGSSMADVQRRRASLAKKRALAGK